MPGGQESIDEIWLEYDLGPPHSRQLVPALFAGFDGGLLPHFDAARCFAETLHPGCREACERLRVVLQTAERDGLKAGRMVGVMLSRGSELRTMIRNLQPAIVREFLERTGWPGPAAAFAVLLSEPVFQGDAARLVLGFAPDPVADCGIEMIYGMGDQEGVQRGLLLRWLKDRGLVDPDRARALDEWRGPISPANSRADWPDALIAKALSDDADRIVYLNRCVSHVTLNVSNGQISEAKAYLALLPVEQRMGAAAHV